MKLRSKLPGAVKLIQIEMLDKLFLEPRTLCSQVRAECSRCSTGARSTDPMCVPCSREPGVGVPSARSGTLERSTAHLGESTAAGDGATSFFSRQRRRPDLPGPLFRGAGRPAQAPPPTLVRHHWKREKQYMVCDTVAVPRSVFARLTRAKPSYSSRSGVQTVSGDTSGRDWPRFS